MKFSHLKAPQHLIVLARNILTVVITLYLLLSCAETEEVVENSLQPGPGPELRGGAGLDRDHQEEEEERQEVSSHLGSLLV